MDFLVEIALSLSTTICFVSKFTFQVSFYAFVFIFAVVFEDTQSQLGWQQTLVVFVVALSQLISTFTFTKLMFTLLFPHFDIFHIVVFED